MPREVSGCALAGCNVGCDGITRLDSQRRSEWTVKRKDNFSIKHGERRSQADGTKPWK